MLTLVTCYPFGWIGPAPMRFIVRAHGVEEKSNAVLGSTGEKKGGASG